jgi:quinohemoprotein ethanol dehydrogenase
MRGFKGSRIACFCGIAGLIISCSIGDARPAASGDATHASHYRDWNVGADWSGYGRTYGEQHFAPSAQINDTNIGKLGLAWSLTLPERQSSVTQPIEVDGVIYFTTGYSNVHAVDAASGKELWTYESDAADKAGRNLRISWGSRGIAWWNGAVFTGTIDGRLVAINARTGKELWSRQTYDRNQPAYITGAPRVFDGKVIIGFGGSTGAMRAYVTTYDAKSGKQLWRFFVTPGNPSKGFEDATQATAAKTWAGHWWRYGGGGDAWNAMAYDPDTSTVFIGTGSGYPYNRRARSEDRGDNLFVSSIVALDAKSGAYKWHYQVNPGDTWDYDATMDIQLAELTIAGRRRKVLMQAPKNGFFYVIDRTTGKLISAEPYARVTWAKKIDVTTGRPIEVEGARYPNGATAIIAPGPAGAHSWMASAYSPQSGLVYIPALDDGDFRFNDKGIDIANWNPPAGNIIEGAFNIQRPTAPAVHPGTLIAWNPAVGKEVWRHEYPTRENSGVLATGGNLVFQGSVDGKFRAFDARSGAVKWQYDAQSAIGSNPISFVSKGRQYVAVLTGLGAGFSQRMAANPFLAEILNSRSQPHRLLVFAVGGQATIPSSPPPSPIVASGYDIEFDAKQAESGRNLYQQRCLACHGANATSATHAPDLRRSLLPTNGAAFEEVVKGGAMASGGMPAFDEFSQEQLLSLRHYILGQAKTGK